MWPQGAEWTGRGVEQGETQWCAQTAASFVFSVSQSFLLSPGGRLI